VEKKDLGGNEMTEETIESIMVAVCDLCHHPYVITDQAQLDAICDNCPVERILKEIKT
jgi:hypothetical protein